jgi:preprotein translocase subunit Sec63
LADELDAAFFLKEVKRSAVIEIRSFDQVSMKQIFQILFVLVGWLRFSVLEARCAKKDERMKSRCLSDVGNASS